MHVLKTYSELNCHSFWWFISFDNSFALNVNICQRLDTIVYLKSSISFSTRHFSNISLDLSHKFYFKMVRTFFSPKFGRKIHIQNLTSHHNQEESINLVCEKKNISWKNSIELIIQANLYGKMLSGNGKRNWMTSYRVIHPLCW